MSDIAHANDLYEEVKKRHERFTASDIEEAKLIFSQASDALQLYGTINQDRKVELEKIIDGVKASPPPKNAKEVTEGIVALLMRVIWPRNKVARVGFLTIA